MRDNVGLFDVAVRDEARSRVERIWLAVHSLGGDGHAYRRERAGAARAVVAEVYSAPRVAAAAGRLPKYAMMPGLALDITIDDDTGQPYEFGIKAQCNKAEHLIDVQQPVLLIGSPMCTALSVIQAINKARRDPSVVERDLVAGRIHMAWFSHLYRKQIARSSYVLHEHPADGSHFVDRTVRAPDARDE